MKNTVKRQLRKLLAFVPVVELTIGTVCIVVVSCLFHVATTNLNISEVSMSLGSSVFLNGHVHRLFTYSFHHEDASHLFLSALMLVTFASGLEKGVGTVRFLYILLLLATCTGIQYAALEVLLFAPASRSTASGLIPISLSVLGMVTIRSRMRKSILMGVRVPTSSLPWFLLFVTLFIPNTVLLCNTVAILTGTMCGMGWFSVVDMSESTASILEKKMPFKLLKRMVGLQFVSASAEERRKVFHTKCNPTPGSYPVQAYATAQHMPTAHVGGNLPNTVVDWHAIHSPQQSHTLPSALPGANLGHSCGSHGHGYNPGHMFNHGHCYDPMSHLVDGHNHMFDHGQSQGNAAVAHAKSKWMPGAPSAPPHFDPLLNIAGQYSGKPLQPPAPLCTPPARQQVPGQTACLQGSPVDAESG